jgi:hypothetical protein
MAPAVPATRSEQQTVAYAILQSLAQEWSRPAPLESKPQKDWRPWILVLLLGSVVLGLTRLATGLWAMRRLESRSRILEDPGLLETLAILRAEMSCVQPVAVRTSAELVTPATIGWKRASILLPEDWSTWDDGERRAILAHELAHVRRGDFGTGFLAQLSLALQFYHPLAHWLAARLRLEQELAADAWSAQLSGGNLPYLTTLAQMALRRDNRALGWPARAFLPSRGTFVRRLEMLRNSKSVRHVLLSSSARLFTVGTLAAIALLLTGMRGPLTESNGQTQTGSSGNSQNPAGASLAHGKFDLKYLPVETKVLLAARPAALATRRQFRAPFKQLQEEAPALWSQVAPLDEIDQLLIFWEQSPPNPPGPGASTLIPPPSGFVLHLNKAKDWKTALASFQPDQEVHHAGQSYFRFHGPSISAYTPDNRTLVLAEEDLLRTIIEDRDLPVSRRSWDEAWNQVTQGHVNMVLDTRWLRRRLSQGRILDQPGGGVQSPAATKLESISPLLEKTQAYALGAELDTELKVDLATTTGAVEDVKTVSETMQAILTLGKNSVSSMRENARGQGVGPVGEAAVWGMGVFATILGQAQLQTNGRTVQVRSRVALDMSEAGQILASFVQGAKRASGQSVSINNLKQIGLAIHNFASANNHLPPPVLYGGPSRKVPHSWRVAILPYLECQDLYNHYVFDEPWDGPNNIKLLDKMPAVYAYPGAAKKSSSRTCYFAFAGPDTMLGKGDKPSSFMDITDGTSNTIMVVEANRDVPWTKPEDLPFPPLPEIGGFNPDGFCALFGDGSVRFIKKSINPTILRALITRAGGEVVSADSY